MTPKGKTRTIKKVLGGLLLVAIVVAIVVVARSCLPRPLPSLKIVFQVAPDPLRDGVDAGLTDENGTHFESIELRSGLPFLPAPSPNGDVVAYRWGPAIDGRSTYDSGQIEFRTARGSYYLTVKDCTRKTLGYGSIRWTPDGKSILTVVFTEDGKHTIIAKIDPSSCDTSQVLTESADGEDLFDPDLSVSGELAYMSHPRDAVHDETIFVMDMQTGEKKALAEGVSPAWSPDGEWLAFTTLDGLYVMRKDGSERRQLVDWTATWAMPWSWRWDSYYDPEGWPARPDWSPDGKWIVYHRPIAWLRGEPTFAIFKLNVQTGEEVKLVDNGINPRWRRDAIVPAIN